MTVEDASLRNEVLQALSTVQDPELGRDLVSLGMVGEILATPDKVKVQVILTTPACPLKGTIRTDVENAILQKIPGAEVAVEFGSRVRAARVAGQGDLLPGVKNIILVASGKGGVGKSTVAVNLALALARQGASVGLMDADIYGPSIPIMLGIEGSPISPNPDNTFEPARVHGISLVSAGFFLPPGKALVWRGPMISKAVQQFVSDCRWGDLDYLVMDLPPGTGDVQLTISQDLNVTGAVIVSTPQGVALADVIRARDMFDGVNIPIIGVIENMSWFVCDGCGKRHDLFGNGGAESTANELGMDFLGSLPLDPAVMKSCDRGTPHVVSRPDSESTRLFTGIAKKVAARVSVLGHGI